MIPETFPIISPPRNPSQNSYQERPPPPPRTFPPPKPPETTTSTETASTAAADNHGGIHMPRTAAAIAGAVATFTPATARKQGKYDKDDEQNQPTGRRPGSPCLP